MLCNKNDQFVLSCSDRKICKFSYKVIYCNIKIRFIYYDKNDTKQLMRELDIAGVNILHTN